MISTLGKPNWVRSSPLVRFTGPTIGRSAPARTAAGPIPLVGSLFTLAKPWFRHIFNAFCPGANHGFDLEDLPYRDNRVEVDPATGKLNLYYTIHAQDQDRIAANEIASAPTVEALPPHAPAAGRKQRALGPCLWHVPVWRRPGHQCPGFKQSGPWRG